MKLEIKDLYVNYGAIEALRGISIEVPTNKVVALIGGNGAGKTTLMRTISGLVPATRGDITFDGKPMRGMRAHQRVVQGIGHSPEGRLVFGDQSVYDNLVLGAYTRSQDAQVSQSIDHCFAMFPRLAERRDQMAGTLSGGEQQMLAIGRALMGQPSLLLLDEPSLGLAPLIVGEVFDAIRRLRSEGMTTLLVEQMANQALAVADYAYVMETGHVTLQGTGRELLADERVRAAYLGA